MTEDQMPLTTKELADLRDYISSPGNPGGSGKGYGWPWGSPGDELLIKRLLVNIDELKRVMSTVVYEIDRMIGLGEVPQLSQITYWRHILNSRTLENLKDK